MLEHLLFLPLILVLFPDDRKISPFNCFMLHFITISPCLWESRRGNKLIPSIYTGKIQGRTSTTSHFELCLTKDKIMTSEDTLWSISGRSANKHADNKQRVTTYTAWEMRRSGWKWICVSRLTWKIQAWKLFSHIIILFYWIWMDSFFQCKKPPLITLRLWNKTNQS